MRGTLKDFWEVPFEHAWMGSIHLQAETVVAAGGFGTVPHIYPVTVVQARYGGGYEGGFGSAAWLAFPVAPHRLSDEAWRDWNGSDVECMVWWDRVRSEDWPVGRGSDPSAAHADLIARVCVMAGVDPADVTQVPTWDRDELIARDGDGKEEADL